APAAAAQPAVDTRAGGVRAQRTSIQPNGDHAAAAGSSVLFRRPRARQLAGWRQELHLAACDAAVVRPGDGRTDRDGDLPDPPAARPATKTRAGNCRTRRRREPDLAVLEDRDGHDADGDG